LKILYFDLDFPFLIKNERKPTGGAAVEWQSWIEGFKSNGHEIKVLTWNGANKYVAPNKEYELVEGIDLVGGKKIIKWFSHRFLYLYKAISSHKPDVLVKECANAYTGILAIIARLTGTKYLYRVANDLDTDERYKNKLNLFDRKLFELGLKLSDYILCQNTYQYNNMIKKFPRKKIRVLYNPVITEKHKINILNSRTYVAWII
jgi:glycosyltransferase involved in cell wall biosynthesis